MRLTIARKLALAVIALVVLCIVTMAWVTSSNLQRGFLAYLNDMQAHDIEQLRTLLAARYRREGSFDSLRGQPDALRDVLDQMKLQINAEPEPYQDRPPPPPPRRRPAAYGGGQAPAYDGEPDRPDRPGPPPEPARPPPGARDPMGFAARLSIVDGDGTVLIGPARQPPGIARAIEVDGRTVGTIRLQPLRQSIATDASASLFLREQLRDILMLSGALIGVSILLALWLARHLLRPVAALRLVTARLARGELDARAPLLSRDELAELALHINAMAQALEESERQRRSMLADISHELRTPLTVIRGEIEALLDGIRQAGPAAFESLHAEVLRLNQLVDDVHQLTLADANELHYQWQPLELGALLRPLLERYQARAAKAGLALGWMLPPYRVAVRGDAGRLEQVVVNLLENSLRYTDAGGRIAVALALRADGVELDVDDSAPGVPDEAHARLFERLYRTDQARQRKPNGGGGGSGLGLALCKALIGAHGGTIAASPSALGGITIRIRLPLHHPSKE